MALRRRSVLMASHAACCASHAATPPATAPALAALAHALCCLEHDRCSAAPWPTKESPSTEKGRGPAVLRTGGAVPPSVPANACTLTPVGASVTAAPSDDEVATGAAASVVVMVVHDDVAAGAAAGAWHAKEVVAALLLLSSAGDAEVVVTPESPPAGAALALTGAPVAAATGSPAKSTCVALMPPVPVKVWATSATAARISSGVASSTSVRSV
jgi:hypothetical protein